MTEFFTIIRVLLSLVYGYAKCCYLQLLCSCFFPLRPSRSKRQPSHLRSILRRAWPQCTRRTAAAAPLPPRRFPFCSSTIASRTHASRISRHAPLSRCWRTRVFSASKQRTATATWTSHSNLEVAAAAARTRRTSSSALRRSTRGTPVRSTHYHLRRFVAFLFLPTHALRSSSSLTLDLRPARTAPRLW